MDPGGNVGHAWPHFFATSAHRSARRLRCRRRLRRPPPRSHREGGLWHQPSSIDLLFITLRKSEALFFPSTRFRDLALGPSLFLWESESTTTAALPTGQRYIHHAERGARVLLFVR